MKYFHEKYDMAPEMPEVPIDVGLRSTNSAESNALKKQEVDLDIYTNSKFVEEHKTDRGEIIKSYEYEGTVYRLNPDQYAYLEDLKKTTSVQ